MLKSEFSVPLPLLLALNSPTSTTWYLQLSPSCFYFISAGLVGRHNTHTHTRLDSINLTCMLGIRFQCNDLLQVQGKKKILEVITAFKTNRNIWFKNLKCGERRREYATALNNALNPAVLQTQDSVKLSSRLQASKYFRERLLKTTRTNFQSPSKTYSPKTSALKQSLSALTLSSSGPRGCITKLLPGTRRTQISASTHTRKKKQPQQQVRFWLQKKGYRLHHCESLRLKVTEIRVLLRKASSENPTSLGVHCIFLKGCPGQNRPFHFSLSAETGRNISQQRATQLCLVEIPLGHSDFKRQ